MKFFPELLSPDAANDGKERITVQVVSALHEGKFCLNSSDLTPPMPHTLQIFSWEN